MSTPLHSFAPGRNAEKDSMIAGTLINAERTRQDKKWGVQDHDGPTWLAILGEEVGELCQCALHAKFGGSKSDKVLEEAVQVAAVAKAIVECLLRNNGQFPSAGSDGDYNQDKEG